jgi:hypothetical protein
MFDPSTGMAVRWVEGKGWIKERGVISDAALLFSSNSIQPKATLNREANLKLNTN